MSVSTSASESTARSSSMPSRRSSSGWRKAMRGAGPAAVGRDQRPLWVSCSPTSGGGAPAAAAASSSRRRRPPMDAAVRSSSMSWLGLARPSGRTATASPPQISAAPEPPKRRQRRSVSGDGRPSSVPSQPSIGWMAKRLASRAAADVERLRQRRVRRRGDRVVAGQVDAEPGAVRAQRGGRLERRNARIVRRAHSASSPASTPRTKAASAASFVSTGRSSAARNSIVNGPR